MNDMEWLEYLYDHNGWSSGEIAIDTGEDRNAIKKMMQHLEKLGYGEYTIFDGMFHFWLSPYGNTVAIELKRG